MQGRPPKDLTGLRFGLLVARSMTDERDKDQKRYWLCQCDCGNTKEAKGTNLSRGSVKSCGCIAGEKHGMTGSPEHYVWADMRYRCNRLSHHAYSNYGGRGISVCDSWNNSFSAFYEDMGAKPSGHELDRRDNDGNYTLDNCRWVTRQVNSQNRRDCKLDGYKVQAIRYMDSCGVPRKVIAAKYNVIRQTVDKVINGQRWSNV